MFVCFDFCCASILWNLIAAIVRLYNSLCGGLKDVLVSSPFGEMIQLDLRIFFRLVVETTNQLYLESQQGTNPDFVCQKTSHNFQFWRNKIQLDPPGFSGAPRVGDFC